MVVYLAGDGYTVTDVKGSTQVHDARLVLRWQCTKKNIPTPLHHHQQPELLIRGRMDHLFPDCLSQILILPPRLNRPGIILWVCEL